MFQVESQNNVLAPSHHVLKSYESREASSSNTRSVGEIVLDLLRGKVAHCIEQLQRKPQNDKRQIFHVNNDSFNYNSSGTDGCTGCNCKFLIIIDAANSPQYWLVQIKNQQVNLIESEKNYLNCIDSLELYSSLEDVCNGENRKLLLSNKNWFFLEILIRINVASGVDVLLEDFTMCNRCRW